MGQITATVTGKTGAGLTMTAAVFTGIASLTLNATKNMLQLVNISGVVTDVSIAAATTFTVTIASGSYTVTIS